MGDSGIRPEIGPSGLQGSSRPAFTTLKIQEATFSLWEEPPHPPVWTFKVGQLERCQSINENYSTGLCVLESGPNIPFICLSLHST